ncbi:hypothetical protein CRG98_020164 [Punica granatum]|uniref:Uncharacterized protein n=1 Tax=Punica granatum TaxID=22663 RepID=A0A2I0JSY0_PUNGR|nr:hypothetical protein CRG98_020164 [Punica granatum]
MGWASAQSGLAFAQGPESGLPFARVWAEFGIAESARFRNSVIHGPIQMRFYSFRFSPLYRNHMTPLEYDFTIRIMIIRIMVTTLTTTPDWGHR